jgi:acid phosphatase (class A)
VPIVFPIQKRPLVDLSADKMQIDATYPWAAWRPDLFGMVALTEFCRTDWQEIKVNPPKPFDTPEMFSEMTLLVAYSLDKRTEHAAEIIEQAFSMHAYFAQLLMLTTGANPYALKIMEMAARVAEMVGVYYKLKFNRARPQQVFPAIVPLLNSPAHASYPSGHSLEAHLIALALAEVFPAAREVLLELARQIGRNREYAGLHFPSDTQAGKDIAEAVFPYLQSCPIFQEVLALAGKEPGAQAELQRPPERLPPEAGTGRSQQGDAAAADPAGASVAQPRP